MHNFSRKSRDRNNLVVDEGMILTWRIRFVNVNWIQMMDYKVRRRSDELTCFTTARQTYFLTS
jgi:hypothetical protein